MKKLIFMLSLTLCVGACGAAEGLRVVQLDLARQMETVSFVKRYLTFAKESGYTHVQLYLEGRIRTKSFPYRPKAETYSEDEIREIVAEAERVSIELVPVVSVLGHAENFVNCPELADICEETRAGRGRFGSDVPKMTFCSSVPRMKTFMEGYLAEVIALFPGKNFHVGLDESFNTGFCPLCAERMKTEGLGGIYLDVIRWVHGVLASHGRRMWMWDDFFEFFPEKVMEVPKDVVLCSWNYGGGCSADRGPRGHFGDRYRHDWMRWYEKLGVDALVCPGHAAESMSRFTEYGRSCKAVGAIFTQWEMQMSFHARMMIFARAAGLYWSAKSSSLTYGEAIARSIASLYPSLNAFERKAVRTLADGGRGAAAELALETLSRSSLNPGEGEVAANPFSERAMLDDLMTSARESLLAAKVAGARKGTTGLGRTADSVRDAKRSARALLSQAEAFAVRRQQQEGLWRAKCLPGGLAMRAKGFVSEIRKIESVPEEGPAADEWQVELALMLEDYHGIPGWTIEGRFEDGWRRLAIGSWKPNAGSEYCYFDRNAAFKSAMAPDRLRITYKGYNEAGLSFIAVANREQRLVPSAILRTSGKVINPSAVLVDTIDAAVFGDADCRAQMVHPERADETSVLELSLQDEFAPLKGGAAH